MCDQTITMNGFYAAQDYPEHRKILMGGAPDAVANRDAMANPASLEWFVDFVIACQVPDSLAHDVR